MRRHIILAAVVMAAIAIPAAAGDRRGNQRYQGYGYGYDNRYGYDRDRDYGSYGPQYRNGNPVTLAMRDLELVFRRSRVDHHEANHFQRALRELADFDRHARRGRFDRDSLDSAIDNMADLAQADQLHPRDRQLIARRAQELHYLRGRAGWR